MPSTDLLNPVTPVLGGAALSSANAIPVKVISSAAATGITIGSTTITGGNTSRLLYDLAGTAGETDGGITYSSAVAGQLKVGTGATAGLAFGAFGGIAASVDGVMTHLNNAGTGFTRLNLGGTSASFPALSVSGNALQAALADGSGFTAMEAYNFQSNITTALVAGGSTAHSVLFSTTANFGLMVGTGAASLVAGIGSLYLRGDGGIPYYATTSAGAWAQLAGTATNTFTGLQTFSSAIVYGGVTFASTATGSGSLVGGTNPTISSLIVTGTMTYGGVTYASTVTGTGSNVLATGPTLSSLTATGTLTYGGVTLASTVTGTGSMVLATGPTFASASTITYTAGATITYGGVTFASTVTGTGSNVLSIAPTFTGSAGFTSLSASGIGTFANGVAPSASTVTVGLQLSSTASMGIIFSGIGSVVPTMAATQGCLLINTTGSSTATRMYIKASAAGTWTNFTTAA